MGQYMRENVNTVTRHYARLTIQSNTVIRNTYLLLSLTLFFSTFIAWIGMVTHAPVFGLLSVPVYMLLLFLTQLFSNSSLGLLFVFAFTGFMGYSLGPILDLIMSGFNNGAELVMVSSGLTGLAFLTLSGYALTSQKDFSYLNGFLFTASIIGLIIGIAALFLQIPLLYLVSSAGFALIASGMILFETSQIIHGGQHNYILATVSLYASIYNLFISLLQLLMAFAGKRDE